MGCSSSKKSSPSNVEERPQLASGRPTKPENRRDQSEGDVSNREKLILARSEASIEGRQKKVRPTSLPRVHELSLRRTICSADVDCSTAVEVRLCQILLRAPAWRTRSCGCQLPRRRAFLAASVPIEGRLDRAEDAAAAVAAQQQAMPCQARHVNIHTCVPQSDDRPLALLQLLYLAVSGYICL